MDVCVCACVCVCVEGGREDLSWQVMHGRETIICGNHIPLVGGGQLRHQEWSNRNTAVRTICSIKGLVTLTVKSNELRWCLI